MEKLPGDYIAGFVDGEGCFALKFRRDVRHDRKSKPIYFYWDIEFAILLREDDRDLLGKVKDTLKCGKISVNKRGQVRYAINVIDDLFDKVIPFFEKHKLYGKKRHDFTLWKEGVEILKRNQQVKKGTFQSIAWKKNDFKRLVSIHSEMKKYKSKGNEWKWIKELSI